jgi:hypothetical protein
VRFVRFYYIFFSEFVCGLSPVCGLLFSQFFLKKIVLALLNLGLLNYLFFMVRDLKMLNYNVIFFWARFWGFCGR